VTTPSQLAFETVRKLISLLKELKISLIGVIENIKMDTSDAIQKQARKLGLEFLEEIPYDPKVEEAIGNTDKLLNTILAKKVEEIAEKLWHNQKN
jgi:MinD superfamily P-loop ATPase